MGNRSFVVLILLSLAAFASMFCKNLFGFAIERASSYFWPKESAEDERCEAINYSTRQNQ